MVDLRCIIAAMRPSFTPISVAADRASHRPAARHATRDRNPLEPLLLAVGTHVAPHCSPLIVRAPNSSLLTSLVSGSPARRAAPGLRQEGRTPMYQPQSVITTAAEVKALLGPDFEIPGRQNNRPHRPALPILDPAVSLHRGLEHRCHRLDGRITERRSARLRQSSGQAYAGDSRPFGQSPRRHISECPPESQRRDRVHCAKTP